MGAASGTDFRECLSNNSDMSSGTPAIVEMSNFTEVDDYITLQVRMALGLAW